MENKKRSWGLGTLRYDPVKKTCWSMSRQGNVVNHGSLPTYGLPREEMPNGKT